MIEDQTWIHKQADGSFPDAGAYAAGVFGLPGRARGLAEAEALMHRLVIGERLEVLGRMAAGHLETGGRRMRARLALGAAATLGLQPEAAAPWAAAVELLHNATLVHDDLQDGDRLRRGRPTVWAQHGAAQAINAGDLMLILPARALDALQLPPGDAAGAIRWRLMCALTRVAEATVRGQSLEMELRPARLLAPADWERAAMGKTGALMGLPVEGSALLRGLSESTARTLGDCFARIGLIYQMGDDVSDCFGPKGLEGRGERGSDLREGKISALVCAHLALYPGDRAALLALLDRPREQTAEADVLAMIDRFEQGGALQAVRSRMNLLSREILTDPALTAIPDLRALASDLITLVETL